MALHGVFMLKMEVKNCTSSTGSMASIAGSIAYGFTGQSWLERCRMVSHCISTFAYIRHFGISLDCDKLYPRLKSEKWSQDETKQHLSVVVQVKLHSAKLNEVKSKPASGKAFCNLLNIMLSPSGCL